MELDMGEGRKPEELYTIFSETEHGQKLAGSVRYERYIPDGVSKERWEEVLGPDVNNLTHLFHTFEITNKFIKDAEGSELALSDSDKEKLQFAAIIHDWAESIDGDVNYNDKTDAHAESELVYFREYLDEFCPDLSADQKKELIEIAEEIVFNEETELGILFNSIERIGYVETALLAFYQAQQDAYSDCAKGLTWLTADVFANQIGILLERAAWCPPVQKFLIENKDAISITFSMLDPNVFKENEEEDLEYVEKRTELFLHNKILWEHYAEQLLEDSAAEDVRIVAALR